jgi:hypothetical protein
MKKVLDAIKADKAALSKAGKKVKYVKGDTVPYLELAEGVQTDGVAVSKLLARVAEDWGQDSDLYSDLTDAIAGWSDRHGNLTPKGILAIKNLLSNWDVLEDYEELLSGNTPQPEGDDDDIPAIYRMYNSDDWVQAQRNMEETVDSLKEGLKFIKGKSREEIKEIVREQILKELESQKLLKNPKTKETIATTKPADNQLAKQLGYTQEIPSGIKYLGKTT